MEKNKDLRISSTKRQTHEFCETCNRFLTKYESVMNHPKHIISMREDLQITSTICTNLDIQENESCKEVYVQLDDNWCINCKKECLEKTDQMNDDHEHWGNIADKCTMRCEPFDSVKKFQKQTDENAMRFINNLGMDNLPKELQIPNTERQCDNGQLLDRCDFCRIPNTNCNHVWKEAAIGGRLYCTKCKIWREENPY